MPRSFPDQTREQWKERILDQRNSGLTIRCWCQQNNIPAHTFDYWKRKLFSKPVLDRSAFTEVAPPLKSSPLFSAESGVSLEYQGIKIRLEREFETDVLKRCIAILKEVVC